MSRCGTPRSAAHRARTLAGALAIVLAGSALYANNIRGQQAARDPADSFGSITLAADAAAAKLRTVGELARAGEALRPAAKTVIVWPSHREG